MADTTNIPVIFLAFANDRDETVGYLRNLPSEARNLREVLEPAEQAGLCEVVVRSNSSAADIFKVFQDPKYRNRVAILHYGGHANGYQLLLESATGESAAADAGGLAKFLGAQQGLQLVFLNGCSTQQQTEGLLEANISAVISTSRAIDDQVATDFSHQFYRGLAGGASIRTAYTEAEASVQTQKGGNTRGLYFGNKDDASNQPEADRWPWNLYLREGSETADQWNLPEAVDDPLFGLPSLSEEELPETPYRHLNWFSRKDAEVFFGRGHQIRELYDRLTAPRTAPIMLFYGQSGVGKSSILDAGLIPRLEQDYEVCYLRRTSGGLLETLQAAFSPEAADVAIAEAWRAKEEQTGKPLIVFLDQVEELYTRPAADVPDELGEFLRTIKDTFSDPHARPNGKLVLSFRKEWLAELETQLIAYELPRTKVFLEALDYRGIIEIVQGPAHSARLRERYGLTVEEGLAEVIADDLLADRDSAIAPTLQILLTKMWNKATEADYEQPAFTQDLYQNLKRDGILLRDFLNQQIAAFRKQYPEAVDSGLLLDIVALHTTPLGTADHRTLEELQQQYAHLGATLPDILQQCQDLHLLTVAASSQKDAAKNTRLAHDTLAPLVREQFEVSDKPGQRARRILDNRAVDWEGDEEGTPLDEADLKLVERGVTGTRALSATEQRLVEASRELRAKLKRMRMTLKIAGAVAVTLIVVAAGVAIKQRADAIEQRAIALEAREKADTNRGLARDLMTNLVPELTAADINDAVKLKLAKKGQGYFQKFVEKHKKDEQKTRPVLADAQYVIGSMYEQSDHSDDINNAIAAYKQARDWEHEELRLPPGDIDYDESQVKSLKEENRALVRDLGYTLNALGEVYREKKKDQQEAKKWYSRAVTVRKVLADLPDDISKGAKGLPPERIEDWLLYASALMNEGLAQDPDLKLASYEKAEEIRQALLDNPVDETEKLFINRHLAFGKHNLALLNKIPKEAKELEKAAIDLYKQVLERKEHFSIREFRKIRDELAICHLARGRMSLEQLKGEDFDWDSFMLGERSLDELTAAEANAAIDDFVEAAKISRALYKERSDVSDYRDNLNDSSFVLVDLYGPILSDDGKPLCQDVVELLDFLRDFHQSRNSAENISDYYAPRYAKLYKWIKGWDGARDQLKLDVEFWRSEWEVKHKDSEDEWRVDELRAELLHLYAEALFELHDAEAKEIQKQSLVLWQKLIDDAPAEDLDLYTENFERTKGLGPPDDATVPSEVGEEHKDPVTKDPVGPPDNAPVPGEEPKSPVQDEPLVPANSAALPSKADDEPINTLRHDPPSPPDDATVPRKVGEEPKSPVRSELPSRPDDAAVRGERNDTTENPVANFVPGKLYYQVYRRVSPGPSGPVVMTWVFEGVRRLERSGSVGDYLYFTPVRGGVGVYVRMDAEDNDRLTWNEFVGELEDFNAAIKDDKSDVP